MAKKSLGTALVTGGAKKLGSWLAIYLAECGYNIIIHYNNSKKEAEILQKQILKMAVKCSIIKADLTDTKQINNLIKEVKKDFKDWNLLVNNASIFSPSGFLSGGIKALKANFDIHLLAPAILSEAFANHCLKKNISGNIINMIDKNITRYQSKYFQYILSKKSLADFTKMVAVELAPQIRVNGIAPGFILSSDNHYDEKKLLNKIPLQKKGQRQNIIDAMEYLLKNNFVTGEILFVDGGASLNHAG